MSEIRGLAESDRLLTSKEAARRLRVHVDTLREWRLRGLVGYVRLGHRTVRIPQSELDRLLGRGARPAKLLRQAGGRDAASPQPRNEQKGEEQ
jgi:excisionase family DNA binding protein